MKYLASTSKLHVAALALGAALGAAGCGGADVPGGGDGDGGGGGASGTEAASGSTLPASGSNATTGATAPDASSGTPTSTASTASGDQGGGGGGPVCDSDPNEDADGDGVTSATGDCNDCDESVSPAATEVAGNGDDDDCDGLVDEMASCDGDLVVGDADPLLAARAIGLCATEAADGYGVIDASWVRANGMPTPVNLQLGILDGFGPSVPPLEGDKVLALSSGHARLSSDPNACGSESCVFGAGSPPPGFPQEVPGCGSETAINDDIALEVRLKAPPTATGYRYRFRFYTFEFPEYVCTAFNDQFVAIASPPPANAIDGNISSWGLIPVSANVDLPACASCAPWAESCLFEAALDPSIVCPPMPSPCCPEGPAALEGTGFDVWASQGAAATSWLETQAPIAAGGEVTIRFAIWDTGDQALDSTVVIDDFAWLVTPGVELDTRPVD